MALFIDLDDGKFEFYDPQGIDPSKRICKDKFSLLNKLELIKNECFADENVPIECTPVAQQKDKHNCLAHVCHFFKSRLVDKSTYESFLSQKAPSMEKFRKKIALSIAENAKLNPPANQISRTFKPINADGDDW